MALKNISSSLEEILRKDAEKQGFDPDEVLKNIEEVLNKTEKIIDKGLEDKANGHKKN